MVGVSGLVHLLICVLRYFLSDASRFYLKFVFISGFTRYTPVHRSHDAGIFPFEATKSVKIIFSLYKDKHNQLKGDRWHTLEVYICLCITSGVVGKSKLTSVCVCVIQIVDQQRNWEGCTSYRHRYIKS